MAGKRCVWLPGRANPRARLVNSTLEMTLSLPRVLSMSLALVFASFWLGCGPDFEPAAPEDLWAPANDPSLDVLPSDDEEALPCACGGEETESPVSPPADGLPLR